MKKNLVFLFILALTTMTFSACSNQKTQVNQEEIQESNSESSTVEQNEPAAPTITIKEGQSLYLVDIQESQINFQSAAKLLAGNVVLDKNELIQADFLIDMQSFEDQESKDFFESEQYPTAELIVKGISENIDEDQYDLDVEMTVKDETKMIQVPAMINFEDEIIRIKIDGSSEDATNFSADIIAKKQ